MLTKTRVIESLQDMPEQLTVEQIVERLQALDEVETALVSIRNGELIPHEEVMARGRQWLKDKQCL